MLKGKHKNLNAPVIGRQSQEDWLPASARHPASKNYSRKGEREIPDCPLVSSGWSILSYTDVCILTHTSHIHTFVHP